MALTKRGAEMITIVSVLVAFATLAVALRFAARMKLRLSLQKDDWLCLMALVCLLGMLVELILWCTIGGNGSHIGDLNSETILNFWKIFLANQFTYFVLCPLLRISIICFYQRLFSTRRFLLVTNCIIGLIALWGVGIFLSCALQCRPLRGFWDKGIEADCFDGNRFFIVNQVFNIIMDFVLLALPLPIIWRLHRSWREKLGLSGIFLIGGFVCFASIYRIVALFYIEPSNTTYTIYQATLWTHIEPSVGMICACLPSIRGLFPVFRFGGTRTTQTGSSNKDVHGTSTNVSSQNRPNLTYIKMNDLPRSDADSEENLVESKSRAEVPAGINVRTEISIVRHDI